METFEKLGDLTQNDSFGMEFLGSQLKNFKLVEIEIEKLRSKMFQMQNIVFEVSSLRNFKALKS